jgi:integrase/recombinase XerC
MWDGEINAYEAFRAGNAASTRKLHRYWIERFARESGEDDPWGVTLDQLALFLANPAWAPETRKSARAALRGFYRWGVTAGRIAGSPAAELPNVRVPRGMPRPTPEDALGAALVGASDRDKLMLLLGAYAGLRASEIARLRVADINEDTIRVTGKGGRVRLIPTHPRIWAAIDAELEQRRHGRLGDGFRYGDVLTPYVFPGQSDGHITPGAVGRILKRNLVAFVGHTLRHRFATRAYAGTRDLRAVQELLGHSRPETTARYTLVPDAALRAAVAAA